MAGTHSLAAAPLRLGRGTLVRTRLLERLVAARHGKCVLIEGPAGSGKTSLALHWRERMLEFGFDFAWLTLRAGSDAADLLDGLLACLAEVDVAIVQEACALCGRGEPAADPHALAVALLRGLQRHPRDVVVLIDDHHHVDDPRADALLQALLDLAPPRFRLALSTRSHPRLSLGRLRDRAELLELGFQDLRFSSAESASLLRSLHPGLDARAVRKLDDMTGGWAAALRMACVSMHGPSGQASACLGLNGGGLLLQQLQQEALAQFACADMEDLCRLAAAGRFNDALAAWLFGPVRAADLLARLRRDALCLRPAGSAEREGWLQFHPVLAQMLVARFEALPSEQQQRIRAELGEWFGRHGQLCEAVQQCVAGAHPERAASWIEQLGLPLFMAGDLRGLVRAVAALPPGLVANRPSLGLWRAWSQLYHRRSDACAAGIEALRAALPAGDRPALQQLALLQGALAVQQDDASAVQGLLPTLESMSSVHAMVEGGRRNILGWYWMRRGQVERARTLLRGPRLPREDGRALLDSSFGGVMAEALAGYALLSQGAVRQAERELRDSLSAAEQALGRRSEPACHAAAFLAAALYECHELAASRQLVEGRLEAVEHAGLPEALLCAGVVRARLLHLDGAWTEALNELDRLEALARARGLDRVLAHALVTRFDLQLCSAAVDAAGATAEALGLLPARQPAGSDDTGREIRHLAGLVQARWLAHAGCSERAQALLAQLLSDEPTAMRAATRLRCRAELACFEARIGRIATAHARVAEVVDDALRCGFVRTLLDLGNDWLGLAEAARMAGRLSATQAFYVEYLGSAAPRTAAGASPLAGTDALSERELDIVRALATAMPNKRIARAFGLSHETVKWHLKNVYAKLGVSGRDGALARARDLGLLGEQGALAP